MWVLNKERKNFIQQGNCMVAMGGKYLSIISTINWQYDDRFEITFVFYFEMHGI